MFSSFSSGKLASDVTGWLSDASKQVQKQVNDISTGVSEMVVQQTAATTTSATETEETQADGDSTITTTSSTGAGKNEVLNQVTAKFATDVTKAWGSALSFGKGVLEKVESSEIVKTASEKVVEVANTTAKAVENAPILSDFNKEQEKFISENKKTDAVLAPWEGYQDEEQLKEQILALSKDKRNFLRAPPAGAQFEFDYTKSQPLALAVLEHDKNLIEMRFQLVPKVTKEVDFWRNYFYRISLIKQSAEPIDLTDVVVEEAKESNSADESEEIKNLEEEFASEEVGTKSEDLPQWEKELQDELQEYEVVEEDETNGEWEKELEDMLGEAPTPDNVEKPETKTKSDQKSD